MARRRKTAQRRPSVDKHDFERLAWFRYQLRRFLRFSESAARDSGVTPQQHQLLLGVAGFTTEGWATISDLAEFLQERHNAVVGLVQRAERKGLVRKQYCSHDRRFVQVRLTTKGSALLVKLTRMHLVHLEKTRGEALISFKVHRRRNRQPNHV